MPLDTVNDIRSMDATGRSRSEIARMLHVSRNTVAKYADMEDMSPAAPMPQRRGGPALEGNEEWVAGVVEADLGLATLMRTVPGGALETGGSTGRPRSSARPACSSSTSSGFSRSTRTGRGYSSRFSPMHTRGSRW